MILRPQRAFLDAIGRVNAAPAILACACVATFLTALPFSVILRESLRAHLGNSVAAEQALEGVNYQWWSEYAAAAPADSIGRSFSTSVIGFATVLENVSALADERERPVALFLLGGVYLLLWLFLAGGILDRYARNRPARAHEFFAACGVYFVRFLRLLPVMAAAYYVMFRHVHGWLFDNLYDRVTADVTVERTAFFWRAGLYALFGLLLVALNILFDYAKIRAVVEDRRSMIGALLAAVRFIRRNAGAVAALYALDALLFLIVLLLYALVAPGAGTGGPWMWVGFLVGQLYLAARLWVRLVFLASGVSLFQGRLAHAGYAAAPPAALPEPPIVEHALSVDLNS